MTSNIRAIWAVAVLLTCSSAPARAYQPGEVFRLDLNTAMMAPQPIGPPAQFEPVPVEARDDVAKTETTRPQPAAKAPPVAKAPAIAKAPRVAAKPRPLAKKQIARRSNPLDANASDTRMQVWPCRSGGICNWRK
jgi:hypothetical protein